MDLFPPIVTASHETGPSKDGMVASPGMWLSVSGARWDRQSVARSPVNTWRGSDRDSGNEGAVGVMTSMAPSHS